MKKTKQYEPKTEMRAEYDFSNAVRGKYARRLGRKTKIVVLGRDGRRPRERRKPGNDETPT